MDKVGLDDVAKFVASSYDGHLPMRSLSKRGPRQEQRKMMRWALN